MDGKALDLSLLGNDSQAIVYFDKILSYQSVSDGRTLDKGNALNNLSRYFEAIASFDKVLNTYPDQDIALNGKGKALFNWESMLMLLHSLIRF